jgi:hypothetical protein
VLRINKHLFHVEVVKKFEAYIGEVSIFQHNVKFNFGIEVVRQMAKAAEDVVAAARVEPRVEEI